MKDDNEKWWGGGRRLKMAEIRYLWAFKSAAGMKKITEKQEKMVGMRKKRASLEETPARP